MHPSAYKNCKKFYDVYCSTLAEKENITVVEIGSQNVNGSIRDIFPKNWKYIGLDFAPGIGVDVVLEDAYNFPLQSQLADFVIASSCFEHSEMFWLTYLEGLRLLKPHGLMYINAPSDGDYHAYPGDSWRFYPDAGRSLSVWAQHNGYRTIMLESYMTPPDNDIWNDFVSVFVKDRDYHEQYTRRIALEYEDCFNIRINPNNFFDDLYKEKRRW